MGMRERQGEVAGDGGALGRKGKEGGNTQER